MYHKILVALDRSATRSPVAEKAISLAQALEANLMLVHVLSAYDTDSPGLPVRAYHSYYPILDSVAWDTYQQRWSTYEQQGLEELRHTAEAAEAAGLSTEFTQAAGDPGRVICDVAKSWGADLILVGHRGRSGLSEFLLGSVSNYVMHHAPCSVLVVHGDKVTAAQDSNEATESHPMSAAS
ncbi:universal stress protein [Leptolyngbya sp. PCC 6406]|uniref:universal stress protein n=1 Tax=Leptolyngbya sp. PCC 6406 TaxID=1173264 RepID=UPI0002AC67FC|nr:universal stress protein [Leptolyngbya sp. PCC 6406]